CTVARVSFGPAMFQLKTPLALLHTPPIVTRWYPDAAEIVPKIRPRAKWPLAAMLIEYRPVLPPGFPTRRQSAAVTILDQLPTSWAATLSLEPAVAGTAA